MAQLVKTVGGLAIASAKVVAGTAIASVKTIAGVDNTSGGGGGITFANANSKITIETPGTTETLSLTISGAMTNGYIVVGIGLYDSSDKNISGCTFNGNAMDLLIAGNRDFFGEIRVYLFGLEVGNLAAASYNVVSTGPAGIDQFVMGAAAYNGVHQTVSTGTAVTANGESTTPSSGNITSASGELVVGCYSYGSSVLTLGSNQTLRWDEDDGTNHAATGVDEPGAATVTLDATLGDSTGWLVAGAPLKPA